MSHIKGNISVRVGLEEGWCLTRILPTGLAEDLKNIAKNPKSI